MIMLSRPLFWLIVSYLVTYWILASIAPMWSVIEVYDALTVTYGAAVLIMYGPEWLRGLMSRRPDQGDYLILGIGVTWASAMLDRLWRLVWRTLDRPSWMVEHPILGFLLALMVLGGVMHLIARFDETGHVDRSAHTYVLVATVLGLMIGAVAVYITPPR